MAKQFDPELRGTLGKNKKLAEQKAGAPEYKGKCQIDGATFWISAWIKEGTDKDTGAPEKFFSLSFEPADQTPQKARPASRKDEVEGDIPF
jgi:hypothetical protein